MSLKIIVVFPKQGPIWDHVLHLLIMSLVSFNLWWFLYLFRSSTPRIFLKNAVQLFGRISFSLGLSIVFSWLYLGYAFMAGILCKVLFLPPWSFTSVALDGTLPHYWWCQLWPFGSGDVCQISPLQRYHFPLVINKYSVGDTLRLCECPISPTNVNSVVSASSDGFYLSHTPSVATKWWFFF